MYAEHYGLREKPFELLPDPRFLYLGSYHREALAGLAYGMSSRKGLMALVGEAGSGKTTIVKHLLSTMEGRPRTAFIFNTDLSFDELLRAVLRELGVQPPGPTSREELLHAFNHHLLTEYRAGGSVLLIIDEAQNLDAGVLENIRMLANLDTGCDRPLNILLVGQPALWKGLGQPNLSQLRQRLAVVCHLRPLSRRETRAYILHRLSVAGADAPTLLTKGALRLIHRHSGGIPRVINRLCDSAFLYAFGLRKHRITSPMVRRVVRLHEVPRAVWHDGLDARSLRLLRTGWRRAWPVGSAAIAATLLLAAVTGLSSFTADRPAPAGPEPGWNADLPAWSAPSDTPATPLLATARERKPSPRGQRANVLIHEVQRGETLEGIAARHYGALDYRVLDLIRRRNPLLGDVDMILPGWRITLPPLTDDAAVRPRQDGAFDVLALGTLSDAQAENALRLLRQAGRQAMLVPVRVSSESEWLEVVVVGVSSAEEATRLAAESRQREWPIRLRRSTEPEDDLEP